MSETTAIILAAGRGTRLGPRGVLTPKGLLRLGDDTLVGESIRTLRARGLSRIVIVTGHLHEHYRDAAAAWGEGVSLIYNPLYGERGSLESLLVGLAQAPAGALILESDFIYEPRAIAPDMADASWLMLSGPNGAGDEVYVWADRDGDAHRLTTMSKTRDFRPDPHFGELVGVLYLSPANAVTMRRVGADVVAATPKADYEAGLVALARQVAIRCPRIDDLAWAEIDDEAMLANAAQVHRRIAAARASRSAASLRPRPRPG